MNKYGDITPRTAAFIVKDLLDRGQPYYVFEKFGTSKPMPTNATQKMKFRRYFLKGAAFTDLKYNPYEYYEDAVNRFDVVTVNDGNAAGANLYGRKLSEGVTPVAVDLDCADIEVTIGQYGMFTEITDVVADTHEDPILQEAVDILGEGGAFLTEKIYYNALIGGSNVFYGGTARNTVNGKLTLDIQRSITRTLKRNLGKPITKVVTSSAAYGTEPIAPAFIAVAHSDLETDIRSMNGFVPAEKYGTMTPWEGEIGKVESVRYILSTVVQSLGEVGNTVIPTGILGTTRVAVYPVLFFGSGAYCTVPLKGKNSIVPMVLNPNTPRGGDQLGQRGSVGIKFYTACLILQDAWMARAEVACSSLA